MGGPGAVLRCPACDEVVLRIVETADATYVVGIRSPADPASA